MVDEALISQKRQDLEYTINQLFIDTHRRSKKERWFCHDFIVVHTYTWSVSYLWLFLFNWPQPRVINGQKSEIITFLCKSRRNNPAIRFIQVFSVFGYVARLTKADQISKIDSVLLRD